MTLRNETWDLYWLSDLPHRHRKWFQSARLPYHPESTLLCLQASSDLMQRFSIFSSNEDENANSSSMHKQRVNSFTEEEKSRTKQTSPICEQKKKKISQPAMSFNPHCPQLDGLRCYQYRYWLNRHILSCSLQKTSIVFPQLFVEFSLIPRK